MCIRDRLGAAYAEVVALGHFLGRLVRVDAELTYTQAQMDRLRAQMAEWFGSHASLTVAGPRGVPGGAGEEAGAALGDSGRGGAGALSHPTAAARGRGGSSGVAGSFQKEK